MFYLGLFTETALLCGSLSDHDGDGSYPGQMCAALLLTCWYNFMSSQIHWWSDKAEKGMAFMNRAIPS